MTPAHAIANPHVFRAYDIRGCVERDFSDAFVVLLGQALGTLLRRRGHAPKIAVGRDARLSSDHLRDLLVNGLHAAGCDTVDVGLVPTPLLYFAVHNLDVGGGVMVTGSHNPAEDNGFKMMLGLGTLHGSDIAELRTIIENNDFLSGAGANEINLITERYLAAVRAQIKLADRPLHVVVDAGNGPTGPVAPPLLRSLGVQVTELYCELDGRFPNHHPDPTVEANLLDLRAEVLRTGADLGIAYDGDGDRIGVLDERGGIIWGDSLLVVLARALLVEEPGATIVGEVKCSQRLFDDIRNHGGRPIMSRVGHSLIKDRMKEEGALLAGEMSGHIFYKHRWFGFDDAVYTTCRLLEILSRHDGPMSSLLSDLPASHTTPELRLSCPDAIKFAVVAHVTEYFRALHSVIDIDGVRVLFDTGWGLVRASNTGPVLVMRCEANTAAQLEAIVANLEAAIHSAKVAIAGDSQSGDAS